jgi:mono/diheme cytochrome c family protein
MSPVSHSSMLLFVALILGCAMGCVSCTHPPGRPAPGPEVPLPAEVMEFGALYKNNCAGCHGDDGKNGAAISLANPVYLAIVGDAIVRQVTANGVAGKLMPPFAISMGGTLTDQQIDVLVKGIFQAWSRPGVAAGLTKVDPSLAPSYAPLSKGNAAEGKKVFAEFCARCHGEDGNGSKNKTPATSEAISASIVDPTFLALVSDQSLRSTIIAGRPDRGMPDWRSGLSASNSPASSSRAMTGQQITDVVAWLAAQRVEYPGQPYVPMP